MPGPATSWYIIGAPIVLTGLRVGGEGDAYAEEKGNIDVNYLLYCSEINEILDIVFTATTHESAVSFQFNFTASFARCGAAQWIYFGVSFPLNLLKTYFAINYMKKFRGIAEKNPHQLLLSVCLALHQLRELNVGSGKKLLSCLLLFD